MFYFSRADESYAVGYIDKGNTEVIAEYIRDLTDAELFKVERKKPYAKDYNSCIKEAKLNKNTLKYKKGDKETLSYIRIWEDCWQVKKIQTCLDLFF